MRDATVDGSHWVGNSKVSIGAFTYGLKHLNVRQRGDGTALTVGRFCSIAENVTVFLGGNHRTDWITTYPFGHLHPDLLGRFSVADLHSSKGDVTIGHDVWLGAGSTIMSRVTIGNGAVIAARAVITRDVVPHAIVAGNPAREKSRRLAPEIVEMLQALRWWDLPHETMRAIAPILTAPPSTEGLRALLRDLRG